MSRAFRLGITGKIGSGKSTFSEVARRHGIKVLEADSLAKEVMNSDPQVKKRIEDAFGSDAYASGMLNRSYLASKIFTDDSQRKILEEIVHPATTRLVEQEFDNANPGQIIALESAILFQTGFDDFFDSVVLVEAKDEDIISRELASGKFGKNDVINRLSQQGYLVEWKEDADFLIVNGGSVNDFILSCERLIEIIKIVALQNLTEEPLRKSESPA